MANDVPEIPKGMQRIYQRFAHWRGGHPGVRLPIPPRLWKAAAKVAHDHGVCRTAQVLRLEYGKLKRMAESDGISATVVSRKGRRIHRLTASLPAGAEAATQKASRARPASLPSFLEVVGSSAIAGSECVIELEGPQRQDAHPVERHRGAGSGRTGPGGVGAGCGDPDHAADAHPGGDRSRRWTQGHRLARQLCQEKLRGRSVFGLPVCVSEPAWNLDPHPGV